MSLDIWEMQIITTMKYHHTPIKTGKVKGKNVKQLDLYDCWKCGNKVTQDS